MTGGRHDRPTPDRDGIPAPETRDVDVRTTPAAAVSTLARTSSAGRGPAVLVAVVGIFLGLALLKPWPSGGEPGFTLRPGTPPPTERPTADPLAGIRLDCQDPPGWRIFSRETWAGGVLRSWRTVDPVSAPVSPTDPTIPVMPISRVILALGYCAPWSAPERPPDDVDVRIWTLRTQPGGSVAARPIDPVSGSSTLRPPLGALYAAPPPGGMSPFLWDAGTYVFELEAPGYRRWWAVEIPEDPNATDPAGRPIGSGPVPEPASPVP